jgi:hypothetical protein
MTAPNTGNRRTERYWNLALAIELLHFPLIILVVVLGASRWHGQLYTTIVTVGILLQVATMGCPVMAFTAWLKRKHDPTYVGEWSFTRWLYRTYGRAVGIAVFCGFLGAAAAIRYLFF